MYCALVRHRAVYTVLFKRAGTVCPSLPLSCSFFTSLCSFLSCYLLISFHIHHLHHHHLFNTVSSSSSIVFTSSSPSRHPARSGTTPSPSKTSADEPSSTPPTAWSTWSNPTRSISAKKSDTTSSCSARRSPVVWAYPPPGRRRWGSACRPTTRSTSWRLWIFTGG